MKMDSKKVVKKLGNLEVNIEAEQEHVGELERDIRTDKERGRGTIKTFYNIY